jgi:hypothetical protein
MQTKKRKKEKKKKKKKRKNPSPMGIFFPRLSVQCVFV